MATARPSSTLRQSRELLARFSSALADRTRPGQSGSPEGHQVFTPSGHHPITPRARYGLALLSGALLLLCFPGPDLGWLAWVALIPLFVALQDPAGSGAVPIRRGAGLGFAAGAVFLGGLLYWIWIFGWYAWLALTIFQGLWIALFGAMAAFLLRRSPRYMAPPVLAASWTVVEWLRSQGSLGLTWGGLAISQHRLLPVLQMLDWTGPWGLTFLIALVNASLACWLVERIRRQGEAAATRVHGSGAPHSAVGAGESSPTALRWLLVSILVVGLLSVRGAWLLARPAPAGRDGVPATTLPVAVVQGNIDQDVIWDSEYWRRALGAHTRLTMEAARAGARLIIWSETSLPGELRHDPELERMVARLARETGASLIIGSNDRLSGKPYNRAFLIDRQGQLQGDYAKRHLVPYGECVPMRAWFPILEKLHVTPFDLTPGEGFEPLRGEHRIGAVICFESTFPYIARALAGRGAEILVEITNDTWFRRTSAAAQHAAMAPLRAVETRRSLARATATGISTLVDDHGRVRRRLGLFKEGYLLAHLPLRRDVTPYVRFGDWPVYLSLFILGVAMGLRSRELRLTSTQPTASPS